MTINNANAEKIFPSQPSLNGELIRVRALSENDEEALHKVAADPLIWKQHPNKYRYTRAEFRKFFSEALESGGALIILDAISGAVIGTTR